MIDATSYAVVAKVAAFDPRAVAVNPVLPRWYIAECHGAVGSVVVLDTDTNAIVWVEPVGVCPTSFALNGAGTRVYVVNEFSDLGMLDAVTNRLVATVALGPQPSWGWLAALLSRDEKRLSIINFFSWQSAVVDTDANRLVTTRSIDFAPVAMVPAAGAGSACGALVPDAPTEDGEQPDPDDGAPDDVHNQADAPVAVTWERLRWSTIRSGACLHARGRIAEADAQAATHVGIAVRVDGPLSIMGVLAGGLSTRPRLARLREGGVRRGAGQYRRRRDG